MVFPTGVMGRVTGQNSSSFRKPKGQNYVICRTNILYRTIVV